MTISVLGGGAFGTALAIAKASTQDVILWAHNPDHVASMIADRENKKRLPGVPLPSNLKITEYLHQAVAGVDAILFAVPLQSTGVLAKQVSEISKNIPVVGCSKGIDLISGKGGFGLLESFFGPDRTSVLTGPSFAADIAVGKPTALTLATKSRELGQDLQKVLSNKTLRLYVSNDPLGAELGGGLKNVIAIACGIVMGADLGESARAAIITRGFSEIRKFALNQGADPETLSGLSGFGDLCLTCTSSKSRNYQFGLALGQGTKFASDATVEGMHTARAMLEICKSQGLEMPITMAVARIVQGELDVHQAMAQLLTRPLKEEF